MADWTIYIGATARRTYQIQTRVAGVLTDVDITGATFVCKLRSSVESSTVIATPVGSITTAAEGKMKVEIDETVTASLSTGSGVWDLYMTLAGDVTYITGGSYRILQRVAR